jgi:hypothetical protein
VVLLTEQNSCLSLDVASAVKQMNAYQLQTPDQHYIVTLSKVAKKNEGLHFSIAEKEEPQKVCKKNLF